MGYVHDQQVAEEWSRRRGSGLAGLDRFEERSSLKTWIFHILPTAKTQAVRERRSMPLSALPEPPPIIRAGCRADRFLH